MIIRPATVKDAGVLSEIANSGFESYRPFAPAAFEPPMLEMEVAMMREQLTEERFWCRLAEDEAGPVGLVGFRRREVEPGVVHLQRLFVLERAWGTGLAAALLSLAVERMRHDGHPTARLFTPAGQARARRFYEREGWQPHGEPFPEPRFGGLELIEYRRALGAG